MNYTTLINAIRDAIAENSAVNSWCRTNYSQAHTVYKGADMRKPPPDTEYPIVHVFPVRKNAGYELSEQDHLVGVTCGINNSTQTTSTTTIEDSIRSATYKWTAAGGGTDEYYCELAAGGDPSLNQPDGVKLNDVAATEGTLGSLSAGEWDWGDNDSLGFSTVYVRLSDGSDPDGQAAGYVEATYDVSVKSYDGVDDLESFRKLVETAVTGASLGTNAQIYMLDIDFEVIEFFPFFLANMEFRVVVPFSQGDDAFS